MCPSWAHFSVFKFLIVNLKRNEANKIPRVLPKFTFLIVNLKQE